jgi:sirohydrochlorin ferrochelatase
MRDPLVSAPVLIALAHGSRDPRSARTVRDIVKATRALRSDLPIEVAFLDHNSPDLPTVVERLVRRGHTEMVVVPLFLTQAYHVNVDIPVVIERAQEQHPGISLRVSQVIGTDPILLSILDQRMRESLRSARVRELDALVMVSAGSSDSAANTTIAKLAQVWGGRHHLPTSVAFASASPPSTGEAVREWRRRGRRHVAVGSFFIAPGTLVDHAGELALEAGAVAVSAPLGPHEEISRLVLARYSVGALDLVEI